MTEQDREPTPRSVESELKPCAHCGCLAFTGVCCVGDRKMYWVICHGTGCGMKSGTFFTVEEAIAAWNRRRPLLSPVADGGLRDALEDCLGVIVELKGYDASYCNWCESHAPKEDDGTITGPIDHKQDCSIGKAQAVLANPQSEIRNPQSSAPPSAAEGEREAFERWGKDNSLNLTRDPRYPDEYANREIRWAWQGWQARGERR